MSQEFKDKNAPTHQQQATTDDGAKIQNVLYHPDLVLVSWLAQTADVCGIF